MSEKRELSDRREKVDELCRQLTLIGIHWTAGPCASCEQYAILATSEEPEKRLCEDCYCSRATEGQ